MSRLPVVHKLLRAACAALAAGALSIGAPAAEVKVAVAANFAGAMQTLAARFTRDTGHVAVLSAGSTGKFHAQIVAGAPFEVLIAADDETPRRLEAAGLAVAGQQFTYARGRLVLWSARAGVVDGQGAVLTQGRFARLAIANPKLSPYGAAAAQTLTALGVDGAVRPKLVQGDNIAQAHQFVATGNAELGLVAQSQVFVPGTPPQGSWWVVPERLHAPILQDATLLKPGAGNPAAVALLRYLRSDAAKAVIQSYGYEP